MTSLCVRLPDVRGPPHRRSHPKISTRWYSWRRSPDMVRTTTLLQGVPGGQVDAADTWPPEVAGLLGEVRKLLEQGQPAAALEQVGRSKLSSPWLANAAAVCQLRLGNAKVAVDTFRGRVLAAGL